ncbi:hypothetical protein GCM10010533_31130 [Mycolicibacterium pallens]
MTTPDPPPTSSHGPQPTPPDHPNRDTPHTVVALLRQLGLTHASAQHQIDALRIWLADHPPSPALRISLHANGYGLLLRHRR